jgi:predicted cupin superfamily sugar epimerase
VDTQGNISEQPIVFFCFAQQSSKEIENMRNADYWIEKLDLEIHPEGGFFKEMYRSEETIPHEALPIRFSGKRSFSTSIYYLLKNRNISLFHRIKQDEIWHFYEGTALTIHCISEDGVYSKYVLGRSIEAGESFQVVVTAGCYFAAEVNNKESYSLVGCTVAPGFDYEDFEIPERIELTQIFPQHQKIIESFTKA